MVESNVRDLESIGRLAAQDVAGADSVEEVEVRLGEDASERPVYYFSFLINQDRDKQRAGLVRIRLAQKLRDALVAQDDLRYPIIQILDRMDWGKRARA